MFATGTISQISVMRFISSFLLLLGKENDILIALYRVFSVSKGINILFKLILFILVYKDLLQQFTLICSGREVFLY